MSDASLPPVGASASYLSPIKHAVGNGSSRTTDMAAKSVVLPPISSITSAAAMTDGSFASSSKSPKRGLSAERAQQNHSQPASMPPSQSALETTAPSVVCFNCGVDSTPLWRRDIDGNVICNACGLYYKLHNTPRPISMKRTVIKRRRRRTTNPSSSSVQSANASSSNNKAMGTVRNAKTLSSLSPNAAALGGSKKIKSDTAAAVAAVIAPRLAITAAEATASSGASLCRSSSMPLQDPDESSTLPRPDPSAASSPLSLRMILSPYHPTSNTGSTSTVASASAGSYKNASDDRCNSTVNSTWSSPTMSMASPMAVYHHSSSRAANHATTTAAETPSFHEDTLANRKQQPSASFGLDSLTHAAEMSAEICLPMPSFHNHRSTSNNMKRSISQSSHESLLDSLATVATAEISLNKRQKPHERRDSGTITSSTGVSFIGSSPSPCMPPDNHRVGGGHSVYRQALERECERVRMDAPM
ncbi:hypothetical protein GGI25_000269 [Coemansia spiralis]|uniref:GATA-type domain-containing protein n=2 Tax=Coemansia TaxID=4863 RepID=A0A9W8L194_9FUNG|nr:hypothetical protein EDC05_000513 [Coemansia umbellata]KAJ2625841.1 hypothetical protein GGI26_000304 [Coemansia sp. RSA 1358]KAJ2680963.1 hypothetical protein GGI25_000269 [Coemansia spiralis]